MEGGLKVPGQFKLCSKTLSLKIDQGQGFISAGRLLV